jgi:hypothetical protein
LALGLLEPPQAASPTTAIRAANVNETDLRMGRVVGDGGLQQGNSPCY